MPISFENISYNYSNLGINDINILDNISFEISKGEFVGIVGQNGSGKTTLIQLIAGLLIPSKGRVYIDGEDINDRSYDRNKLRRKIGFAFQFPEYQLFETTVKKDVAFGLRHENIDKEEVDQRVKWALELFDFEYERIKDLSPLGLSGGEKRRVALAGILAIKPDILIFDEPIAGLDPSARSLFLDIIEKLNKDGITIIMVSHNIDVLCEYSSRLIVLDKARIVLDGNPSFVFNDLKRISSLGLSVSKSREIAKIMKELGYDFNEYITSYKELVPSLAKALRNRCDV